VLRGRVSSIAVGMSVLHPLISIQIPGTPSPTIVRCTHTQTTKFKNWNIRSSVEECGAKFIRGFKLKAIIVWRIVIGRSLYVEQIAFFNPEKSTTCQHIVEAVI
jgi:hypothetical protein